MAAHRALRYVERLLNKRCSLTAVETPAAAETATKLHHPAAAGGNGVVMVPQPCDPFSMRLVHSLFALVSNTTDDGAEEDDDDQVQAESGERCLG